MKLVIISGPVCSGKTTIVNALLRQVPRYFHLSYDSLKWQFSQYSSGKYYEEILTLRLAMLRALCEMDYNILTESTHVSTRKKHVEIAQEYGYEVLEINLEAPYELLLKRCLERNENGKPEKIVSRKRFDEVFNLYEREKNKEALTIRSDIQSIHDITESILGLL